MRTTSFAKVAALCGLLALSGSDESPNDFGKNH